MKPPWDDDERLLAELAVAVREVEPMAERVARQAMQLFSWRTVDEELFLAGLSYDSAAAADGDPVGGAAAGGSAMRAGPGDVRVMVFDSAPLSMELEVATDQIAGQLIPPGPARVFVEDENGITAELDTDDRGFFVIAPIPVGRMRLRCDTAAGRVRTDWMVL